MRLGLVALITLVVWGERPNLLPVAEQEYGARLVCHVFRNRLEYQHFSNDYVEIAVTGFWGWQEDETFAPAWIGHVVQRCLVEPDPTEGAFYVFSRQDLTDRWWRWDTATAHAGSGAFSLWTFREIPEELPRSPVLER